MLRKLVWLIGWVRFDSDGLFETFQVSIVAVFKRIDTLCRDYFWRESVPEVDDPVGEEVLSCGAVLCDLAPQSLFVSSGATRWSTFVK